MNEGRGQNGARSHTALTMYCPKKGDKHEHYNNYKYYKQFYINVFNFINKWLRGQFICIKCQKIYSINSFGYGTIICPNCYNGEKEFLSFDESYWLNRILTRLPNLKKITHAPTSIHNSVTHRASTQHKISPGNIFTQVLA